MFQGLWRVGARIGVMVVVAATIGLSGLSGLATGPVGVTTAGAAVASSETNPYLPSTGHAYRHGAVPSKDQEGLIRGWRAQHSPERAAAATGPDTMYFFGGLSGGAAAVTATPKVYLVFWGNQWGSQGADANGNVTLSNDTDHGAPYLQQMFRGLGTGNELWSGTMTQYCDGPLVAALAASCPSGAPHIGYPNGNALSGVWYDNSAGEPSPASYSQIAAEVVAAANHFGNTSVASNRYAQYVVLSAPGTNPDSYKSSGFCAWHDYETSQTLGNLAFTNMPYVMDVGWSCGAGFVNNPGTLDGYSIVEGHEYAETLTDEYPSAGWLSDSSGNVGSEVGDECAWIAPGSSGGAADVSMLSGSFSMQSTWSNDTNSCAISHPVVTGANANTVAVTNPGSQSGTAGVSASLQIHASDSGGAALTYGASGLPAGLSINTSTGLISGIPTTSAGYTATVTAADTTGANGSATFSWSISPSTNTVGVTNPGAQTTAGGTAVNLQIHANDSGGAALTYSASGLPAGLAISKATGLISGTPTTASISTVTVTATDIYGAKGSTSFSWTINPSTATVTVTNPGAQTSTLNTRVTLQIQASDSGGAALTYAAAGLPAGLTMNKSTGVISGTATTVGTSSVTVSATDAGGAHGSASFSWTVQKRHH